MKGLRFLDEIRFLNYYWFVLNHTTCGEKSQPGGHFLVVGKEDHV